MQQVGLNQELWKDFVAHARRRRRNPRVLLEELLHFYLERLADEELFAYSEQTAQAAEFSLSETESIIRKHRRNKLKRRNGRS